jgi:hypothetical protein
MCNKITGVFMTPPNSAYSENYSLCNGCLQMATTPSAYELRSALKKVNEPFKVIKGSVSIEVSPLDSTLIISVPNARIILESFRNAFLKTFIDDQSMQSSIDFKSQGYGRCQFYMTQDNGKIMFVSRELNSTGAALFTQCTYLSFQDSQDLKECLLQFI